MAFFGVFEGFSRSWGGLGFTGVSDLRVEEVVRSPDVTGTAPAWGVGGGDVTGTAPAGRFLAYLRVFRGAGVVWVS